MPAQLVPRALIDAAARRFQILSEPVRLMILSQLNSFHEMRVQEIVDATGQKQANVSKHLRQMFEEGVVGRRRDGQSVYYFVADPTISAICLLVCGRIKDQLAEEVAGSAA